MASWGHQRPFARLERGRACLVLALGSLRSPLRRVPQDSGPLGPQGQWTHQAPLLTHQPPWPMGLQLQNTRSKKISGRRRQGIKPGMATPPFFLGPRLWHMEIPRLGVESALQGPAYPTATATATWDLSCVCDLHHSSQATLDPRRTEQGQGSNPHPHGSNSGPLTAEPQRALPGMGPHEATKACTPTETGLSVGKLRLVALM